MTLHRRPTPRKFLLHQQQTLGHSLNFLFKSSWLCGDSTSQRLPCYRRGAQDPHRKNEASRLRLWFTRILQELCKTTFCTHSSTSAVTCALLIFARSGVTPLQRITYRSRIMVSYKRERAFFLILVLMLAHGWAGQTMPPWSVRTRQSNLTVST